MSEFFGHGEHDFIRYRMIWSWGFWKIQEGGRHITWDDRDGWRTIRSTPFKDEATAYLVKLKLQGHNVEL